MSVALGDKILVVDDMSTIREEVIRCLTQIGYTNIEQAVDGQDAWNKLKAASESGAEYKMIFSDINMPNCNGIELLKVVRKSESYETTPIIMISTENEKDVILTCIQEGANNYILKPFDSDTVKEKIDQTLERLS
ncbi:response regulator [Halobacteriovorax sp. HLS]|uniref:response regulator n=1 Tax=Halobacteriovorax sp. HLS TaxID=2234000 RepID=UPI000FD98186|nr:response regulator [Halobacteriovorax sp. HLS]